MFKYQAFTSHSDIKLSWKINCDDLTNEDLEALATRYRAAGSQSFFTDVVGVARGGLRFAEALRPHAYTSVDLPPTLLIVDDVLTQGTSMQNAKEQYIDSFGSIKGLVIFNRGCLIDTPRWIQSIFTVNPSFSF